MTVLTIELPGYGAGLASLIVETSKDSALDRLSREEIDAEIAAARGGCPAIPADWPRHTQDRKPTDISKILS